MNDLDLGWLPEHYECEIGKIDRGWSDKDQSWGIQVVSFRDRPESGVTTFATLGLSRHLLKQPSGQQVRQELLISAKEKHADMSLAKLLLFVAERVLKDHNAVLRGELVGPDLGAIPGSTVVTNYVTNPSPFEGLLSRRAGTDTSIVFAYLVPVTASEASLIRKRGWRWFEAQLEAQNPDIWDFGRAQEVIESGA